MRSARLPIFCILLISSTAHAGLEIFLENTTLVRCESSMTQCAPGLRLGRLNEQLNPGAGPLVAWQGIVLSEWIERLLAKTPLAERVLFDLVILKNARGEERWLPRWVVTRYPVLVATHRAGQKIAPTIVLPWTSRPRLAQEELPLAALQLQELTEIRLVSWEGRLGEALLARRTDPVALRGEKLHAKNCVVCHSGELAQKPFAGLPLTGAPHAVGASAQKSLQRYFEMLAEEKSSARLPGSDPTQSSSGGGGRDRSPWSRHLAR